MRKYSKFQSCLHQVLLEYDEHYLRVKTYNYQRMEKIYILLTSNMDVTFNEFV